MIPSAKSEMRIAKKPAPDGKPSAMIFVPEPCIDSTPTSLTPSAIKVAIIAEAMHTFQAERRTDVKPRLPMRRLSK